MTEVAENGSVQAQGIPPVEDEDIKDSPKSDKDSGEKSAPKAEKKDGSQPAKSDDSGAKEKGPGPWSQKLVDAGLDDPAFDEFLRNEIQPYITQLEQGGSEGGSSAMWEGDTESEQAAFDLLNAFREDPQGTLAELNAMFGGEEGDGEPPVADDLGDESFVPDEEDEVDPRLQYVEDLQRREQEQRDNEEFQAVLDEIGQHVGEGFDPELYTLAFVASDGDWDMAYQRYMQYHRVPEKSPEAPNVLGDDGGTPPPAEPEYSSIGDAIDSFVNEDKARRSRS